MLFVSQRLNWQGTGTAIDTAIDSAIDPAAAETKPGRPRKRDQGAVDCCKVSFLAADQFLSQRESAQALLALLKLRQSLQLSMRPVFFPGG